MCSSTMPVSPESCVKGRAQGPGPRRDSETFLLKIRFFPSEKEHQPVLRHQSITACISH